MFFFANVFDHVRNIRFYYYWFTIPIEKPYNETKIIFSIYPKYHLTHKEPDIEAKSK